MIAAAWLFSTLTAVSAAPVDALPPIPLAVFVARIDNGRALPNACAGEKNCMEFDPGYELELEPVQLLLGPQPDTHKANVYAHSGFPSYGHYPHALVFEFLMDDGRLLSRTGFPVALTTDGRWAFCADGEDWKELQGRGRPVKFAGLLRLNEATKSLENAELGYTSMKEGQRSCRRGIHAEELAAIFAVGLEPDRQRIFYFESKAQ